MTLRRILGKLFFLATALFLFQITISAQDMVEQYSRFLPEKYVRLEYQHEQLSKLLKAKSSIHPDLIYYYITYYNKLSQSSSRQENEAKEFQAYLNSFENSLIQKRNAWADMQIAVIDTFQIAPELKNRAQNLFRELKINSAEISSDPKTTDISINENLLNYFAAFFYNPDSYPSFLSDLKYFQYKKKEEEKLKSRILSLYDAAGRKDANSNRELINLILDRWYLSEISDEGKSGTPKPGEMVLKLLNQNSMTANQSNFSVGIMYSPFNIACNLRPSLFIKGLDRDEEFKIRNTIPQIGLSLGYRYYLKDSKGLFSALNFQLLYFRNVLSSDVSGKLGFSKDFSSAKYNYHEELNFTKSNVTPKSAQSCYIKITTPVLFLLNTISMDCGAYAGLNSMKYKYVYEYRYMKTASYYSEDPWEGNYTTRTVAAGSDKKEFESQQNDFIFSPVLELSVNSMDMVSMGITLSLQYSSFLLQYEF